MNAQNPITVDEHDGAQAAAAVETAPVVIEVRGVDKTFRVPERRVDTLKERATHPFSRLDYRELRALRDISFDIHKGEFFGIVGQNGSGKSTLLKILASIYRADAGRIRVAGRLAPFIELGVGFNPELTARENIVINGVLMGLSKREARRRLDAVLDFAELEEFMDLKLKNYSSGMMVRLAFAVMVQADADIMLVDEVLAVGDFAFAQKCMDVFHERRRAGKTILLVTHDMGTVQSLCDRAMFLQDGGLDYMGDPEETATRYYRRELRPGGPRATHGERAGRRHGHQRTRDPCSAGERGGRADRGREQGQPILLDALIEAQAGARGPDLQHPRLERRRAPSCSRSPGTSSGSGRSARRRASGCDSPGESRTRWCPAATRWTAGSVGTGKAADLAFQCLRLLDFVVSGTRHQRHGLVGCRRTWRPSRSRARDRSTGPTLGSWTCAAPRRSAAAGGARGSCCR